MNSSLCCPALRRRSCSFRVGVRIGLGADAVAKSLAAAASRPHGRAGELGLQRLWRGVGRGWLLGVMVSGSALSGCVAYTPAPLPDRPGLTDDRPERPFTLSDLVSLALRNDPDLKAARLQAGVAESQLVQARLMPDPIVGGSLLPLLAGPGSSLAWTASVSLDLRALVTLRARSAAARLGARQVVLSVLWREWQVAGEVRALGLQQAFAERRQEIERRALRDLEARDETLRAALSQQDAALQTTLSAFSAAQALRAQVAQETRDDQGRRRQLNALLGREPDAPLTVSAALDPPRVDPVAMERAAAELARRRPDLIALRLGYGAQDARVRAAVLSQFPVLTLGPAGGSDNSNVRNAGPAFTLQLPVFDRGRGEIAVQTATRRQLAGEYLARLDEAYAQIRAGAAEASASQAALTAVRADLPAARAAAAAGETAYQRGLIDLLTVSDLRSAQTSKEVEAVQLEQADALVLSGLAALTGAGLPLIDGLPEITQ